MSDLMDKSSRSLTTGIQISPVNLDVEAHGDPPMNIAAPASPASPTSDTSSEPYERIIPIRKLRTAYAHKLSDIMKNGPAWLLRQWSLDSASDEIATNTNVSLPKKTDLDPQEPPTEKVREFIVPIALPGGGYAVPSMRNFEPWKSQGKPSSSEEEFQDYIEIEGVGSNVNELTA